SELMLARARSMTNDPAIAYARKDLETVQLKRTAYALVYSSLTFHYLYNLEHLLGEVRSALIAGGSLVFSVEHPIFTAPLDPGWIGEASGRKTWPVNGYLSEGERSTDWLAKGVIKQHRTIATYFGLLLRQGFAVTRLEEWGPSSEQIAAQPSLRLARHPPPF